MPDKIVNMTDSEQRRYSVIVTQFVTAAELCSPQQQLPVPLFVEDGIEETEPTTGARTKLARLVSVVHDHFGPGARDAVSDAEGSSDGDLH